LVAWLGKKIITEDNHDERIKKMLKFIRFYLGEMIVEMNNFNVKYKKFKGKNVRSDIMANIRDKINLLMKAKLFITLDIKYMENKANKENNENKENYQNNEDKQNKANKVVNNVIKKQCHRSIARYSKDN
jgi:hypothetical protein